MQFKGKLRPLAKFLKSMLCFFDVVLKSKKITVSLKKITIKTLINCENFNIKVFYE